MNPQFQKADLLFIKIVNPFIILTTGFTSPNNILFFKFFKKRIEISSGFLKFCHYEVWRMNGVNGNEGKRLVDEVFNIHISNEITKFISLKFRILFGLSDKSCLKKFPSLAQLGTLAFSRCYGYSFETPPDNATSKIILNNLKKNKNGKCIYYK